MSSKYVPLLALLAIAGPAHAINVNMTGFEFGGADSVAMTGTDGSPSYEGAAGPFVGGVSGPVEAPRAALSARTAISAALSPQSITAWCAELTQSFSFGVNYEYAEQLGNSYFGDKKAADLSRLFTAAQGFVVDSGTSAAMQAGIWEIIYEHGAVYGLDSGNFRGAPELQSDLAAFSTINGFLANLSRYDASYHIEVLVNGEHQDFLVATIPEPETWGLFAAGLAAMSLWRRRRKA
ncbi:MAG: PEP-CTERM sorting domain-containing protein [Pseudomonadota bacterium]|nr:PEP-CTERM sorting domain-containing protein [Pseudomonadota bacterium]